MGQRSLTLRRAYLALQGLAVLAWWGMLGLLPASRAWFVPRSGSPALLFGFLPADLLLVAAGSLASAWVWRGGDPPRGLWVVAGALWYGTIYLVSLLALGEVGPIGPALMVLASSATAWTLVPAKGR